MENATGFNPEQVRINLKMFDDVMKACSINFRKVFNTFNNELVNNWASPKAKEFNWHLGFISSIDKIINRQRNSILESATNAARKIAFSNGMYFAYDFEYMDCSEENGQTVIDYVPLKVEKDGKIGMNINAVEIALQNFFLDCAEVKSMLEEVPMDFALFDPAGELITEYRNKINFGIDAIETYLKDAIYKVEEDLFMEQKNVEMGMQQALELIKQG